MQWPSRAEYTEAVRDYPHVSLQDPKLKDGKPRRGKDGFLISDAGAFSIVFPIDVVSKTFALRCWTQDVRNAKIRYEQISAYLESVSLPYFVDFEYVPEGKGVLVNGTEYPITRMEWVDGVSLRGFIEQNLQDPHIFKVIADEFQKMVAALHKHQIAHGDLQDGNILLERSSTGVKIKLIDYDSLVVPALQGQPEQIVGLPQYQHPKRIIGGGQANEKVDYFSELVIYLSFLSLSENPALWTQFGDESRVDRGLLFSKKDFENPDQSDVFQELANLSADVQRLAATLKDFCVRTSLDELEPLEDILPNPPKTIWQKITDVWQPLTEAWQQIPDVWQQIISGLKNNQRFIPAGVLSLALVICFVAFLTQMDAKNVALLQSTELTKKLNQKESEIHQQQLEIQGLTSSVQTLKGTNQTLESTNQTLESTNQRLKRDNSELRNELENMISGADEASENVMNLRRQLNEEEGDSQNLRNQLTKKDTEIRQLRSDKAAALSENRRLQRRLVEDRQNTVNQDATVQQLRTEKLELQSQNQNFIRQNQRLRDEKKALQSKLNDAEAGAARRELDNGQPLDITRPEPPRRIDAYRDNATLASIRDNNYGINAFILKDYREAIAYFKQAVRADSHLAITHYNLGCVYLEMRDYRRAISAFGKAVVINDEFKDAYYNLSITHLSMGNRKKAKNAAEAVLTVDKNYQRARDLLTVLQKALQ